MKNIISGGSLLLATVLMTACGNSSEKQGEAGNTEVQEEKWSERLAASDMQRFGKLMTDDPRWGYHQGLIGKSMLDMWKYTGEEKYFDFVKAHGENVIDEQGNINTYDMKSYNIDNINSGKLLIPLYQETGDTKYRLALDTLMKQLEDHPRTKDGGFWHKKRYTHQKWLDGLYMAAPFLVEYGLAFDEPEHINDAVNQLILMDKHAYDPEAQLLYHGWDESKEQDWADKGTGLSANFWSRSIGWYAMALVDVLELLPEDHPDRGKVIAIAQRVAQGIRKYQDDATGAWYQVTDQGDREGNYLESSGTAMFVYFLYKGVEKGYLDQEFLATAQKGYEGLVNEFFQVEEEDGSVTVKDVCSVAGLGGSGNRDGSFDYYISEPIKDNDPKGTAPAIMASIAHERSLNK